MYMLKNSTLNHAILLLNSFCKKIEIFLVDLKNFYYELKNINLNVNKKTPKLSKNMFNIYMANQK